MMWRDFAIALSLSNLCFIGEWRWLIIPSHSFYHYHTKVPPPPAVYAALVLDVLLFALVLFVVAQLVRRSQNERIRMFSRVVFVLMLSLPIHGLLQQLDIAAVRQFLLPAIGDETRTQRIVASIPLTGALFLTLVSLLKIGKALKVAVTLILVVLPFVLVTFFQAGMMAMRYGHTGHGSSATPIGAGLRKDSRVLWFIFDELEFRTALSERPPSLDLTELDRLVNESLSATNAFPPAQETFLSIPALTTGRLVSSARRASPEELMIKFGDDTSEVPWSKQPNTFSLAREFGFNTALFGWYHPYCRVLGDSLTKCGWQGGVPFSKLKDDAAEVRPKGVLLLAINMYGFARQVWRTVPVIGSLFRQQIDAEELVRRKQLSDYNVIYRQAVEAANDTELGLVMIHWPIPHPPNIYDRAKDRISIASGKSYIDNVRLVDRTIGDIRRIMESNGNWKNTVVLITSDHWWRTSHWKNHVVWTQEDAVIMGKETDRRVPFILKMAGDSSAITYTQPFNTVLSHDLLLAILRGEVLDTKGAAAWLDQHRSIGRSPYDERSSEDAL